MSSWRFADDASYECFAGAHLPWAIIACLIVGLVCVPLPLLLPFLHHYAPIKPFSDVYSSLYKKNRRWWCSVDLLRRLVLAAVYTGVDNPENGHLAMTLTCFFFAFCTYFAVALWILGLQTSSKQFFCFLSASSRCSGVQVPLKSVPLLWKQSSSSQQPSSLSTLCVIIPCVDIRGGTQ